MIALLHMNIAKTVFIRHVSFSHPEKRLMPVVYPAVARIWFELFLCLRSNMKLSSEMWQKKLFPSFFDCSIAVLGGTVAAASRFSSVLVSMDVSVHS